MPFKTEEARRAYQQRYREENREKMRAYFRNYAKKNRDRIRAQFEEWKKANPGKTRAYYNKYHLKTAYEMTPEQYEELYRAQDGRCACCGQNAGGKRLCVDHDHQTGRVRGLLCRSCNLGIGNLGDSAEGVRRALVYLERGNLSGQD